MNFYQLIEKKRDGHALSKDEINLLIQAYNKGTIPDYQMAAFAMAVYFQGMTAEETSFLTESMMNSGTVLTWDFNTCDKHSTGGVGDKISIVLAPILAAIGLKIPMIAGKGLGHTGGTIDKLESIKGFNPYLNLESFQKQINTIGLSIIGQTDELAPADKKLYALRDVTATVPSIPLITASILSKKLAEGIDSLVMDIKFGSAAFMKDVNSAKKLAISIQETGKKFNKSVHSLLTNMDEPLGRMVGNHLEIIECIDFLENKSDEEDLKLLTYVMAAILLIDSKLVKSFDEAFTKICDSIQSGKALEKFLMMLEYQGAVNFDIKSFRIKKQSTYQFDYLSEKSGFIQSIDALKIGRLCVEINAGRKFINEELDYFAGVELNKKRSDFVEKGDHLLTVYYSDQSYLEIIKTMLSDTFSISNKKPKEKPLLEALISDSIHLKKDDLNQFKYQIMDLAKN
jgi:pyrimidine-nucleoside phosphorylase